MKEKPIEEIRNKLILSGRVIPDFMPTVTKKCNRCGNDFYHLANRIADVCGSCEMPRRRDK